MLAAESESNLDFDNTSNYEYEKFVNQLSDQLYYSKPNTNKGPMTIYIEIDYNSTKLKYEQIIYAIQFAKTLINSQFNLISPQAKILFTILYGIIILFGLVSNTLMIYAFYKAERLRTFRNIFIINLAISDILLCSICAPLTLFKYSDIKWRLGRLLCKLGPGLQTINVMVTVFSITTIAVDRWQFIVHYGKDATKKIGSFFCILLIWLIGFVISVPTFIVNDLRIIKISLTNETLYEVCEELWFNNSLKYAYSLLTISFQYVIPLIIVSTTNCQICYYLYFKVPSIYSYSFRKRHIKLSDYLPTTKYNASNNTVLTTQDRTEQNPTTEKLTSPTIYLENENKSMTARNIYSPEGKFVVQDHERFARSKHLLLAVCLSFAICWLPLLLLNLYLDIFRWDDRNWDKITHIFLFTHLIAMISCCINPIIYGLLNTNFKEEIFRIVFGCCIRK